MHDSAWTGEYYFLEKRSTARQNKRSDLPQQEHRLRLPELSLLDDLTVSKIWTSRFPTATSEADARHGCDVLAFSM